MSSGRLGVEGTRPLSPHEDKSKQTTAASPQHDWRTLDLKLQHCGSQNYWARAQAGKKQLDALLLAP